MESYQKAKMPPPVPPKYHKLSSNANSAYQKENVFENGYHHHSPAPVTGGALIQTNGMRVKIRINPENPVCGNDYRTVLGSTSQSNGNNVKINVNGTENHLEGMLLKSASCHTCKSSTYALTTNKHNIICSHFGIANDHSRSNNSIKYVNGGTTTAVGSNSNGANGYFCHISSGQSSPSDNLDSGTCSDVDTGTPPPYSARKKSNSKIVAPAAPHHHQRCGSLNSSGIGLDSDEDDNVSCDSINSSEYNGENENSTLPIISAAILKCNAQRIESSTVELKEDAYQNGNTKCEDRFERPAYLADKSPDMKIELTRPYDPDDTNTDRFLHFHLNENNFDGTEVRKTTPDDDTFAGYKSLIEKNTPVATIRSAKGTVRGVKNRVRAGIATFLNNNVTKTWQDKEAGKVVVYTTTMGIVRETYHRCLKVRQILRTHLVKFEEKDVFMSRELQKEIRERMNTEDIVVPQVFVEGIHIGDAEIIDRLNESGELRQILKPYKSADALNTCQVCGGYRLLPCNMCNGSKKSVYRNHFTTELVTLKCMNCDEVGLIKCYAC